MTLKTGMLDYPHTKFETGMLDSRNLIPGSHLKYNARTLDTFRKLHHASLTNIKPLSANFLYSDPASMFALAVVDAGLCSFQHLFLF